ncbi:MAG: SLBB domain-containing protein [Terracidiphilus sp.]
MSILPCGTDARGRVTGAVRSQTALPAMAPGRLRLLILILAIAPAAHAQMQPEIGYPQSPLTSNSSDCSDPLFAGTAACASQSSQTNPSLRLPQSQVPGVRPQIPNGYSDLEQWSRQEAQNQARLAALPPGPLTEFQKFIASTTGQVLPIYGADLFRSVPSTFAPVNNAPVPPDYVIGPDDVLRIRIWGQINFQADVRVDRSGDIYLPQVGTVHVAGLPFSAIDAHLRQAIGRVYRNFDLSVDLGQIRSIEIYVSGEARRPGMYTVSSLSTLADAVFATGGPSIHGSMRHILLRRGGDVVTDFDLYSLLIHGDKSKDAKLLPGDVIFIPPAGPQAALTGSVRNPGIYELGAGETLSSLIDDAGGVSAVASDARVSIERIDGHQSRQAMEVAYDAAGKATHLADGDLIRVYSIIPRYTGTVILRGNIANPGRFAWHPGMRISDLIPDKDSLITRNYWWRRAQLGLPTPEFEPMDQLSSMRQPAGNNPVETNLASQQGASGTGQPGYNPNQNLTAQQRAGSASLAAEETSAPSQTFPGVSPTRVQVLAPDIDWNYAVIERLDPATLKTTLIPFDLGKAVLDRDASQDLPLEAGDVVTIFSAADIRLPIEQQTKFVTLGGEFVHGGVYSVRPGETLRDLVQRAGGFTPSAYLYGSQFTRESTRLIQQARIDEYVQSLSLQIQRNSMALAASLAGSPQGTVGGSAAQSSGQALIANLRQVRATGRVVFAFKPGSSGIDSIPKIPLENGDRFVIPQVPSVVNVVGAVYDQNSFLYAEGRRVETYLHLAGGADRAADRRHEFVIRADGEVVSRTTTREVWGNEFDGLPIYPGDTIVVPEKTYKPSAMRGVLAYSQLFSQFALGAASLSVIGGY